MSFSSHKHFHVDSEQISLLNPKGWCNLQNARGKKGYYQFLLNVLYGFIAVLPAGRHTTPALLWCQHP